MADGAGFSVPIYPPTSAALLTTLARGPDLSWIGNLGTNFGQGLDFGQQQRVRNLFAGGLPIDPNTGQPDYAAAGDAIIRAMGPAGIDPALKLQRFPYETQMLQQATSGGGTPTDFSGAPVATPAPGAQSQGGAPYATPPSSATAIPNRTPPQPSTDTSVGAVLTNAGQDAQSIAAAAGVPLTASMTDPSVRARVVAAVRASQAPAQPGLPTATTTAPQTTPPGGVTAVSPGVQPAPQPPSQRVAQGFQGAPEPVPPDIAQLDLRARTLEAAANRAFAQANALDVAMGKGAGDAMKSRAEAIAAAAKTARDQVNEYQGKRAGLGIEASKEVQAANIKRGEAQLGGILAAASQYQRDLAPYNTVARSILNDPRAYTGIGADAVLDANKLRGLWTQSGRNAAQLQEMLEKVRASSVLSQINTQKDQMQEAGANSSRIFSSQIQQVEKASPGLENTLQGNRALVNIQTKMGELQLKVADLARDYVSRHGYLDIGFDAELSNYLKANPVFTRQEQDNPGWLGAPDAPSGAARWTPQQAVQWGATMGLKPGDVIRINGRYAHIPSLAPQ